MKRTLLAAALAASFTAQAGHMAPGGVTYYANGVLDTDIKRSAVLTACLDVVPITPPGRWVDEHGNALVYLTATNSHPHSLEAVMIYNRRKDNTPEVPTFGVYDWSLNKGDDWNRWVDVRLPFVPRGRFCYQNITRKIRGNTWANILRVEWDGKFHTVYKHKYQAHSYSRMFWGPISEEFPPGASEDMAPVNWSWSLRIDGKAWSGKE